MAEDASRVPSDELDEVDLPPDVVALEKEGITVEEAHALHCLYFDPDGDGIDSGRGVVPKRNFFRTMYEQLYGRGLVTGYKLSPLGMRLVEWMRKGYVEFGRERLRPDPTGSDASPSTPQPPS